MRAARRLAEADIVIWGQALLAEGAVQEYARADAELVTWPPATMADIHAVYDRAQAEGLVVARLLWGDPSLFGTVRDEIAQARDRGLECELVPGVSSLSAAAAILGHELTRAPESTAPLILTAARGGLEERHQVRDLARHGATIAAFMLGERAEDLQRELLAGGYAPQTPCAIAHRVSWEQELVLTCRLEELAATIDGRGIDRHTLVIAGPALGTFPAPAA